MIICFDGDEVNPEIEISGTAKELESLGNHLTNGITDIFIESQDSPNRHYPVLLEGIRCRLDESLPELSLLTVRLKNGILEISGGLEGLKNLGQSCINIFSDAKNGDHIHFDYFEGNQILAKTNCSLIFYCSEAG